MMEGWLRRLFLGLALLGTLASCSSLGKVTWDSTPPTSLGMEMEGAEPDFGLKLLSSLDTELCTIEKRSAITAEEFESDYQEKKPVVLVNMVDNTNFGRLTLKEELLAEYGKSVIVLSSANTFSYEKRKLSLATYVDEMVLPQSLIARGNETWYHFGNNDYQEWEPLFAQYNRPPPFTLKNAAPSSLSFGIGGHGSGVPLHVHGAVYSEVLHGKKRWFLYPPSAHPSFDPDETTLQWLHFTYPHFDNSTKPIECVLDVNEILYLPSMWWHSTLNIGEFVVFMSTFV